MAQGESDRSRKIMAALRERGWFCFKVHGNGLMRSGLNDIMVCAEGLFIGIETKMEGKGENTSGAQKLVHQEIRDAGGVAEVAITVDEAIRVVEQAIGQARRARRAAQ